MRNIQIPINQRLGESMAQILDEDVKSNVLDSIEVSTNSVVISEEQLHKIKSMYNFLHELVYAANNVLIKT